MAGDSFVFSVMMCIASECLGIFYTYFIGEMIKYIKDPKRDVATGLLLIGIFFAAQVLAQIFRNRYILNGFETAIKIRRILIGALYDKVINLSVKGMTETNSGKLISLISADLFQVERGLSFATVVVAAPIVNIVAYVVLSFTIGWQYTLVAVGCWILLIIC